jgi:hypothetical protein
MVRKRQLCLINFEGRGSQLSKSSIKNTKYYSNKKFDVDTFFGKMQWGARPSEISTRAER